MLKLIIKDQEKRADARYIEWNGEKEREWERKEKRDFMTSPVLIFAVLIRHQ